MAGLNVLEALRRGELAGTRRLDLNGAGLTALPAEVFGLADTLEVLNLSDNQLAQLPADLPRLHRLKVLFCSGNPFTHLPEVLGSCPALEMIGFKACRLTQVPGASLPPSLRWLTLTDNAIRQLPHELGERPRLQKLMLAGNRLTALPERLAAASGLELLRLSANQLASVPGWLPELPRLAWLALAGNPSGGSTDAVASAAAPLPAVAWSALRLDGLLGEGASGHIHRAHRLDNGAETAWALKLFKGAVTSDGLPEHELAACVAAGPHPHLCTPVATLAHHPQGQSGMLLPLVPPGYEPLAGPPSLDSCTRDVYAPQLRLQPHVAVRLLHRVASAVAHLHSRGVMHGDLYAHNTLWLPTTGDALLSDMGAATVMPSGRAPLRRALLALEALALGHLFMEVLARVEGGAAALPAVWSWAQACTAQHPADRPDVRAVATALAALDSE